MGHSPVPNGNAASMAGGSVDNTVSSVFGPHTRKLDNQDVVSVGKVF